MRMLGQGMRRRIAAAFLALLVGGCGTPSKLQTASGRPEISIPGVTVDAVKAEVVRTMTTEGFRITRDTQYEMAFDRPAQGAAAVLFGSRYDPVPSSRISFSFASMGNSVLVTADAAVVTNPGSGFEQRTDTNGGPDGTAVQAMLEQIGKSLNPNSSRAQARKRGVVLGVSLATIAQAKAAGMAVSAPAGVVVRGVTPGMPAARAGILKSDVIVSWAGQPTDNEAQFEAALAATSAGATIRLGIVRGTEQLEIPVTFDKPT